jgi:hypothetical protein
MGIECHGEERNGVGMLYCVQNQSDLTDLNIVCQSLQKALGERVVEMEFWVKIALAIPTAVGAVSEIRAISSPSVPDHVRHFVDAVIAARAFWRSAWEQK